MSVTGAKHVKKKLVRKQNATKQAITPAQLITPRNFISTNFPFFPPISWFALLVLAKPEAINTTHPLMIKLVIFLSLTLPSQPARQQNSWYLHYTMAPQQTGQQQNQTKQSAMSETLEYDTIPRTKIITQVELAMLALNSQNNSCWGALTHYHSISYHH